MSTVAIHVVWTTYLTWPPGDERGHWSPLLDIYGSLKARGHRLNMGDGETRQRAADAAVDSAKRLDGEEIAAVAAGIGRWINDPTQPPRPSPGVFFPRCHAAAIESTHVHLLLGACGEKLASLVGRIKGSTASTLLALPRNAGRTRIWTANFWRVFLFDDQAAQIVRQYIEAHNIRAGLPAAPFSWIMR